MDPERRVLLGSVPVLLSLNKQEELDGNIFLYVSDTSSEDYNAETTHNEGRGLFD